ncbi:hypothetical protein [Paenibacillus oralis]|uniref:hypothetical protein n=1 Tax=Paenibacillus oralis TaxID=2490856 RepID=UPI0026D73246
MSTVHMLAGILYPDFIHARSLDSKDHSSRHDVKTLHGGIRYLIPGGVPSPNSCGKTMYKPMSTG